MYWLAPINTSPLSLEKVFPYRLGTTRSCLLTHGNTQEPSKGGVLA